MLLCLDHTSAHSNNSLSFGPPNTHSNHLGPGGGNSNYNNNNINPYSYAASSSTSIPPPAAAFAPSLKILKRPNKNDSAASALNSQAAKDQKKSLKDREKAYNEARNRIFGATSPSIGTGTGSNANNSPKSGASSPSGLRAVSPMSAEHAKKSSNSSAPPSPNPNLDAIATLPSMESSAASLTSSIEQLDLDKEQMPSSTSSAQGAGEKNMLSQTSSKVNPALGTGLGMRSSSNRGRPRISSSNISLDNSPSSSVPGSRSATPTTGSVIIREPVNPPTATAKQGSATAQAQARGFTKTKKKKMLSPAAVAFVPGGFGGGTAAQ